MTFQANKLKEHKIHLKKKSCKYFAIKTAHIMKPEIMLLPAATGAVLGLRPGSVSNLVCNFGSVPCPLNCPALIYKAMANSMSLPIHSSKLSIIKQSTFFAHIDAFICAHLSSSYTFIKPIGQL